MSKTEGLAKIESIISKAISGNEDVRPVWAPESTESKDTEINSMEDIEKNAILHDIDTCHKDECMVCSYILCPHQNIDHCHHDGCPVCTVKKEPSNKQ